MIRSLLFLILAAVLAGLVYWCNSNFGEIKVITLGYELETSLTLVAIIFIATLLFFHFTLNLILGLLSLPTAVINRIHEIRNRGDNEKLYKFFDALCTNNVEIIQKIATELKQSTLPIQVRGFVSLFAAKTTGYHNIKTEALLELAQTKEWQIPALSHLANVALVNGDLPSAIAYAEKVWELEKEHSTLKLLIKVYALASEWQKLASLLDSFRSSYVLGREKRNLALGVARFMLATEANSLGDIDSAMQNVIEAQKLIGHISPVQQLLIKLQIQQGNYKAALSEIKESWKSRPDHYLTALAFLLKEKLTDSQFFEFARDLLAIAPNNYESHIVMAQAALDFDQFDIATKEISEALGEGHKVRACQLMAKFCIRMHIPKAVQELAKNQRAGTRGISDTYNKTQNPADDNTQRLHCDEGYGSNVRSLWKLASGSQVQGAYGTEDRNVSGIHEDLSTGVTKQLAAEVEFRKRSIEALNWLHYATQAKNDAPDCRWTFDPDAVDIKNTLDVAPSVIYL